MNTFNTIIERVCFEYSCSRGDLLASSGLHGVRMQGLVRARQALYFALRVGLGWSFPMIGKAVGGRDHTTVMYGVKRVARLLDSPNSMFTHDAMKRILAPVEHPEAAE